MYWFIVYQEVEILFRNNCKTSQRGINRGESSPVKAVEAWRWWAACVMEDITEDFVEEVVSE